MKILRLLTILLISFLLYNCENKKSQQKEILIIQKKSTEDLNEIKTQKTGKIKYSFKFKFEDFPVHKYPSKKTNLKLNLKSSSFAKRYKTMINQTYQNLEINYAGKYIVDYWGCGSPCAVGIAINSQNGKLIELPSSSVGYKFRKDSRLLILNPPDSSGYYIEDCSFCVPEYYVLDTLKIIFTKLEQ